MRIKLQVIARVLRIIEEKLHKEIKEGLTETEAYEQSIYVMKEIWK